MKGITSPINITLHFLLSMHVLLNEGQTAFDFSSHIMLRYIY